MKNNRSFNNGISLIVLIITVIVMIILASAVILTLSDDNVILNASNSRDLYNADELKDEIEMYRNVAITEGKDGIDTFPVIMSVTEKASTDSSYLSLFSSDLKSLLCNLEKDSGGIVTGNINDKSNYSNFYIVNKNLINSAKNFENGVLIFVENGEYTIIAIDLGNYTSTENKTHIITTVSTTKQSVM